MSSDPSPLSPVTPDQTIADLCRKHHVPLGFGNRLLPLVRRALASPEEKRERLLQLVDRSFAEEARRRSRNRPANLTTEDRRLLRTVGNVLHGWEPPDWMLRWKWPTPPGEAADEGTE